MEEIRLQKYLAECNVASRRACEGIILAGRVCVNGTRVTVLGTKVTENDTVTLDGKEVKPETKHYYILLNKPIGYVTSVTDDRGRATVMELISGDLDKRIYPVGRLDFNTEGLLLLSNDGDFTYKLTHPKHKLDKVYEVLVSGKPEKNAIYQLEHGIEIDGKKTAPAKAEVTESSKNSAILTITIHEGRNRQIRKMCQAVGFRVLGLKRIAEGNIRLGNLPVGKWRHLSSAEVDSLLRSAESER